MFKMHVYEIFLIAISSNPCSAGNSRKRNRDSETPPMNVQNSNNNISNNNNFNNSQRSFQNNDNTNFQAAKKSRK